MDGEELGLKGGVRSEGWRGRVECRVSTVSGAAKDWTEYTMLRYVHTLLHCYIATLTLKESLLIGYRLR